MEQVDHIDLPQGEGVSDFKPVAYYDKHMDCIRVVTHDRSVTEVRVDDHFTLHRSNGSDPFGPKFVGFTMKGVAHVFDEVGLPRDRALRVAQIVDAIVKHSPGSSMAALAELVFSNNESSANLVVDFAEASTA